MLLCQCFGLDVALSSLANVARSGSTDIWFCNSAQSGIPGCADIRHAVWFKPVGAV